MRLAVDFKSWLKETSEPSTEIIQKFRMLKAESARKDLKAIRGLKKCSGFISTPSRGCQKAMCNAPKIKSCVTGYRFHAQYNSMCIRKYSPFKSNNRGSETRLQVNVLMWKNPQLNPVSHINFWLIFCSSCLRTFFFVNNKRRKVGQRRAKKKMFWINLKERNS